MHRTSASFLIFLIGWASLAPAQESGEAAAKPEPATISVTDPIDDEQIERAIRRIFRQYPGLDEIDVDVSAGVVALTGEVDTGADLQKASTLTRSVEGVIDVLDSDIEITGSVDWEDSVDTVRMSLLNLWRDFIRRVPFIVAGVVVLLITAVIVAIVRRVLRKALDRKRIRYSLRDLAEQLTRIGLWTLGLLVSAVIMFPGITPSKVLTVLGLGSVAIGFAFKDIFENFFAGVLILWRYPFDRGDFVACGEIKGCVEEITIRNTMIRRLDGELAVVPNATLFKETVDVLTNQKFRRVQITAGVAYGEDIDRSRKVIEKAVGGCVTVEKDRLPEVFAYEFADSSVNFEVTWWTGSRPADIRRSRDEVVAAIKRALDEADIEIPFPYRTLTFKEPLRVEGQPVSAE